jgi:hypothetical protein
VRLKHLVCLAFCNGARALGGVRVPPQLDIPVWKIKLASSSLVRTNMKSPGNRPTLRLTALLRLPVVTP